MGLYEAGKGLAQGGAKATPKMDTYQSQNKIDAGFKAGKTPPPPPPPPRSTKK